MDSAECYLCDTCISSLRGKNKIKDHSSHGSHSLSDYHHQKYEDLVVSKDNNCFVYTWLWNKLPILPDSDPSKIDGFRIYCTVNRPNLKFLAVCPWAMNVVLKGNISAKIDDGSLTNTTSLYVRDGRSRQPGLLASADLDFA